MNIKFQFQCGAIGRLSLTIHGGAVQRFNSSVVRLVGYCAVKRQIVTNVSIPVWCDW